MKQIITTIMMVGLLTLCSISAITAQVIKFKTIQVAFDDGTNTSSKAEWTNAEILVVLNFDDNKLKVYSKETQDYDLIESKHPYNDENENTWFDYVGIDQNGRRCNIKLEVFKDKSVPNIATLFIQYSDREIIYRMKKDI